MGMSRRLAVASLGGLLAAGLLAIGLHTAGATEPQRAQAAGDAEARSRLFLVGCASCHGQNGEAHRAGPRLAGWAPPPPTSSCRRDACRTRRPTGSPSRKRSPYTRRRSTTSSRTSRRSGPVRPSPMHNPPGDLQEGGELYLDNCAACHSAAGNGGAERRAWRADAHGATPVEVAEAIRTGPGNMPVFGPGTFTPQQVNSIVRYVEYLAQPQDPGGLSLAW